MTLESRPTTSLNVSGIRCRCGARWHCEVVLTERPDLPDPNFVFPACPVCVPRVPGLTEAHRRLVEVARATVSNLSAEGRHVAPLVRALEAVDAAMEHDDGE